MIDIFLSYASDDRERVRPLAQAFMQEGLSVFWDFTIPAGMTWRGFLLEKLEETSILVVVWSKYSTKSDWVTDEADYAKERKKPIIPVLLEDVKIPLGFRSIQAKDLSGWDGSTTSPIFQALLLDIKLAIIKSRQEQQETQLSNQQTQIRLLQVTLQGIVTQYEYDKLEGLRREEPFWCWYSDDMLDELRRLRAMGLINHHEGKGLAVIKREYKDNNRQFDLKEHFYVTKNGQEYIELRRKLMQDTSEV